MAKSFLENDEGKGMKMPDFRQWAIVHILSILYRQYMSYTYHGVMN